MNKYIIITLLALSACSKEELTIEPDCDCEIEYIIGSFPALLATNCGFLDNNRSYKIGDCIDDTNIISAKQTEFKSFSETKYWFRIKTNDTIINWNRDDKFDYIQINDVDTIQITSDTGFKYNRIEAYRKFITEVNDSIFAVKRPDSLRFPTAILIGKIHFDLPDFPNHSIKLHFKN